MTAQRGKSLLIAGGVVILIVIAGITVLFSFDINKFKANIESAAIDATGLDVRINGKMEISFFPFGVSAKDIHVANKGGEIVSIENLELGAKLMPLLKKQLKVTSCELVKPSFTIEKSADGSYNFESTGMKSTRVQPGAPFSMNDLNLSKGGLVYLDKKTGEKTEVKEFNLAIKNLSVVDTSRVIINNISFAGNMDCKEVRKKDLKINNIRSSLKAEQGIFSFKPITMDIFDAKGEGDATLDMSNADAVYKINLKVSQLDFAKFEHSFGIKKVIGGKGDFFASLTMKEIGNRKLMSSLDGTFSLRGDNLVIYTVDLDKILTSYETSQEFNLVDLGALFIAAPISTFAVRAYRSGDLYNQTRGGQGVITHFNSHWKIKSGVADATDCALATHHNRVALKGKLDLVTERYDTVVVALLDNQGCAKFKQSISGSFSSPQIGAMSVAESLAGPFSNLYRKAQRFIQGGACEVFYHGTVQQPSK